MRHRLWHTRQPEPEFGDGHEHVQLRPEGLRRKANAFLWAPTGRAPRWPSRARRRSSPDRASAHRRSEFLRPAQRRGAPRWRAAFSRGNAGGAPHCGAIKSQPGPLMKFDNATAADAWLIVCCWDCRHQVETDPAELARHSAISRLPGAFSTHMGSTSPVCRGIHENDSRTRSGGSIEGAVEAPFPWPGVTKSPRDRDWVADGRDCNRHQRVCWSGLQPEERIRSRPSSRPAGTLSADLE